MGEVLRPADGTESFQCLGEVLRPADCRAQDDPSPEAQGELRAEETADAAEGLPVFGKLGVAPEVSLVPEGLASCPVYKQESCAEGALERCELYDQTAGDWAEAPDKYAEQIFWYDRYFDLYHRMEGRQAEFLYVEPMPPGTPESVWGAPESFQTYTGHWDSAGWTGTALQAAAAWTLATWGPSRNNPIESRMPRRPAGKAR